MVKSKVNIFRKRKQKTKKHKLVKQPVFAKSPRKFKRKNTKKRKQKGGDCPRDGPRLCHRASKVLKKDIHACCDPRPRANGGDGPMCHFNRDLIDEYAYHVQNGLNQYQAPLYREMNRRNQEYHRLENENAERLFNRKADGTWDTARYKSAEQMNPDDVRLVEHIERLRKEWIQDYFRPECYECDAFCKQHNERTRSANALHRMMTANRTIAENNERGQTEPQRRIQLRMEAQETIAKTREEIDKCLNELGIANLTDTTDAEMNKLYNDCHSRNVEEKLDAATKAFEALYHCIKEIGPGDGCRAQQYEDIKSALQQLLPKRNINYLKSKFGEKHRPATGHNPNATLWTPRGGQRRSRKKTGRHRNKLMKFVH